MTGKRAMRGLRKVLCIVERLREPGKEKPLLLSTIPPVPLDSVGKPLYQYSFLIIELCATTR